MQVGQVDPEPSARPGWLGAVLGERSCKRILDAACGHGGDSLTLVEQGLDVVSCDCSDSVLNGLMALRWKKRMQPGYDKWVITKARLPTLEADLGKEGVVIGPGFDTVLCLNNAFTMLQQEDHMRAAISNMANLLKKGGVMIIDQSEEDTEEGTGQLNGDCAENFKNNNVKAGSTRLLTLERFEQLLKTSFGGGYTHSLYAQYKTAVEEGKPCKYYHVIDKM